MTIAGQGEEQELRGILFDYSGTVLISGGFDLAAGLREVCSTLTLPPGTNIEKVVSFAVETELELQRIRDQTQLEFRFDSLLRLMIDYVGAKATHSLKDLESVYYEAAVSYGPAPGVEAVLRSAIKAGIKTGIVSNSTNSAELLQHQIEKNGLGDLFGFLISSADYGIRKQHPLLFDVALARLGLPRENVVFIGDNLEYDIKTAQAAGLAAVWYNHRKLPHIDGVAPDYTIVTWDELDFALLKPKAGDAEETLDGV
jgi:putative hydrolase of the HAD superfamily